MDAGGDREKLEGQTSIEDVLDDLGDLRTGQLTLFQL
jgi:hypothetical protein